MFYSGNYKALTYINHFTEQFYRLCFDFNRATNRKGVKVVEKIFWTEYCTMIELCKQQNIKSDLSSLIPLYEKYRDQIF